MRGIKRFFFEKKKQKTFAILGRWRFHVRGLTKHSFFVAFFSKKEALTCSRPHA